ncbi:DNA repair protein rad2 [Phlyctochytrium planicorne]|nr:DNA repair protein rad2 [Phlyctochytrium planicorne]
MRDSEGNPVRGAHLIGFFRRICKLLFYGVQPIFVFDGATPTLKRATVSARRRRRADADAGVHRTAEKLLMAQLQMRAVQTAEMEEARLNGQIKPSQVEEGTTYMDDTVVNVPNPGAWSKNKDGQSTKRAKTSPEKAPEPISEDQQVQNAMAATLRQKRKRDEFELPPVDEMASVVALSSDPRLADERELHDFITAHRDTVDLNSLNLEAQSFADLPVELQYQFILDLKTNSREASSSRVEELLSVPSAIDFSLLQIRNLVHRNTLTEKLFDIARTGGISSNPDISKRSKVFERRKQQMEVPKRIASMKGREYILVKNDDAAGAGHTMAWAQTGSGKIVENGKISNQLSDFIQKQRNPKLIELGDNGEIVGERDYDSDEDEVFEDVKTDEDVLQSYLDAGVAFEDMRESFPTEPRSREVTPPPIVDLSPPTTLQKDEFEGSYVADNLSAEEVEMLFREQENLNAESGPSRVYHSPIIVEYVVPETPPAIEKPGVETVAAMPPAYSMYLDVWVERAPDSFSDLFPDHENAISTILSEESKDELDDRLAMLRKRRDKLPVYALVADKAICYMEKLVRDRISAITSRSYALTLNGKASSENDDSEPLFSDEEDVFDSAWTPSPRDPSRSQGIAHRVTISGWEHVEQMGEIVGVSPTRGFLSETFVDDSPPREFLTDLQSKEAKESPSRGFLIESFAPKGSSSQTLEDDNTPLFSDDDDPIGTPPAPPVVSDKNTLPTSPVAKDTRNTFEAPKPSLVSSLFVEDNIAAVPSRLRKRVRFTENQVHEYQPFEDFEGPKVGEENDFESNDSGLTITHNVHPAEEGLRGELNGVSSSGQTVEDSQLKKARSDSYIDLDPRHIATSITQADETQTSRKRKSSPELDSDDELHAEPDVIPGVEDDPEERLGVTPVAPEEDEDFARFVAQIQNRSFGEMASDIRERMNVLVSQKRKDKRDADTITTEMINESQNLLCLFGLPYIIAPMEAESQCAWLLSANLVDGIVTDDSDVFLFGGTLVYKNVFNQNKYVESYSMERLESTMGLGRRWLCLLAYLLGSDYTEGIPTVGIVTAMEILKEFGGFEIGADDQVRNEDLECLVRFKEWVRSVQMGEKDKTKSAFRSKFKRKAKALEIPEHFPDPRVIEAYFTPQVDEENREFQWGSPDLNGIRDFMQEKAGFLPIKTDEVLIPVIREMVFACRYPEGANTVQDKQRNEPNQTLLDKFFAKKTNSVHSSSRVSKVVEDIKARRNQSPTKPAKATGSSPSRSKQALPSDSPSRSGKSVKSKDATQPTTTNGSPTIPSTILANARKRSRGRGGRGGRGIGRGPIIPTRARKTVTNIDDDSGSTSGSE